MRVLIIIRTGDGTDARRLAHQLKQRGVKVEIEHYSLLRDYREPYDLAILYGLTDVEEEAFHTAIWVRVAVHDIPLLIVTQWESQEHNIAERLKKSVRAEYALRTDEAAVLAKVDEMLNQKAAG